MDQQNPLPATTEQPAGDDRYEIRQHTYAEAMGLTGYPPPDELTDSTPQLVAISEADLATMKQAQMAAYLSKHQDWCSMWAANHKPHQKFPIIYNDSSLPVWLNRATRRKLKMR